MGSTITTGRLRKSSDPNQNNPLKFNDYENLWLECVEKSCVFVWCDATIGTPGKMSDTQHTIKKLADIINQNGQLVHTFDELNACREFIVDVNNVCLIVSGSMGEELVPLIHNLDQIRSIYVFCFDTARHYAWASNYPKIRKVCADITGICESIKSDIITRTLSDHNRIQFDLISPDIHTPTDNRDELSLIYTKLSKIILLNMDSADHGKQNMINYCRSEYTRECQVQLINDLERNYSQHNPIWWYTRNCFFQGIINRALHVHNLYVLCSMSRFVKDMNSKLQQLYESSEQTSTEALDLYFGQVLSKQDFDRIRMNHGGLMCINQFISANPEKGIAMMFIKQQQQNSSKSNGNQVHVLFQIHIDRTVQSNVSYANIGSISEFVHEKEYLISMGSIYRINKIDKLLDLPSAFCVQMILVTRNDLQYNNLTASIQEEQLDRETSLSELGHVIQNRLHIFKSANRLFRQVLMEQKQELRTIILHYNMAIIYDALGEYDRSINDYQLALNLAREVIPSCYQNDDVCLAPLYSNMALTYQQKKNQFNTALISALRALRIVLHVQINPSLKKELESSCYYCLASIHDQEGRFNDARGFYESALKIRQEYLPIGHPDVTYLQRLITLLPTERNDFL